MSEPTEEDYETGRALAGMAEADGAVGDGADVGWMIAHEIAKARAGETVAPDWIMEVAPCVICGETPDDHGEVDLLDIEPHPYAAPHPYAIDVTFYVTAPSTLPPAEVVGAFEAVLDWSTAREALAEGLDCGLARVSLSGLSVPEIRDVAESVHCDTQPTTMTTNTNPEEGKP